MKKMIIVVLGFFVSGLIYAAEVAKLGFNIAEVKEQHPHFLCIYNMGCFNLLSMKKGKTFSLSPNDLANVKQIAIADGQTRKLYLQELPASCQVKAPTNTTLILTGKMAIQNASPVIRDFHCEVNTVKAIG